MADFSALKTAIQANIRTNANEEITGAILQEILLSMVTTLGDGAINGLVTALQAEVEARQNAVGGEATARQEADSALSGRINGEATARGEADTQLQNAINGITTRLNEGYVYVGIATPSTNPSTPAGHVFYIALQGGTYTNFSSLAVTQGINILKYNGTAWSQEQLVAIDDVPTAGSNNLVKSGGIEEQNILTGVSGWDILSIRNPSAIAFSEYYTLNELGVTGTESWASTYRVSNEIAGNNIVKFKTNSLPSPLVNMQFYKDGIVKKSFRLGEGWHFAYIPIGYTARIVTTSDKVTECVSGTYNSALQMTPVVTLLQNKVENSSGAIILSNILRVNNLQNVTTTANKILKKDGSIGDYNGFSVSDPISGNSVIEVIVQPLGGENVNFALYKDGVVTNFGYLPIGTFYMFVPYGYTMRVCGGTGFYCKYATYNDIVPLNSVVSNWQQFSTDVRLPQVYDLSTKTAINFTDDKILNIDGGLENFNGYSVSDEITGNNIVCIDSNSAARRFTNFVLYSPNNQIVRCDNLPDGKYFYFIPAGYRARICTTTAKKTNCYYGPYNSAQSLNDVIQQSINPKLNGKKISWYGTSIPANEYPSMVGTRTGATVTNEAQGSSMARRGAKSTEYQDDPYKVKGLAWSVPVRGLMMSVAERNDIITNWLDYVDTWVGTYEGEQGAPTGAKPRDINDGEHEELKSQIRNMCYDVMIARHCGINNQYNTGAVDVSDIYVIEHAYNDVQPMFNDAEADFSTLPADPYDRNHPIGAINAMIKYIYENNPNAKIALIGHYECQLETGVHAKSVIEKVAEYWSLPLLKLYDILGFSQRTIPTNGYWDTSFVWHNTGFSFVVGEGDTWTSNCLSLSFNMVAWPDAGTVSGSTVSGSNATRLMSKLGITAGNGNAIWNPTRQEMYLTDNLHPTANSTRDYFAEIISNWLCGLYAN